MLAADPRRPADVGLFTSTALFGQPGLYPDGPPMAPAAGEPMGWDPAGDVVADVGGTAASRWFGDPSLRSRCGDPAVAAAVALLAATVAAPLVEAFAGGALPVTALALGEPDSPGRVVGPVAGGDPGHRVVNRRYRAEHPGLVVASLAHALLWSGPGAGHDEEATLHLVGAVAHLQLVDRQPALAHTGTELARRQNSVALSVLTSRHPGDDRVSVVAPDGPGTLPGGDPAMDTPDFWSIPFGPPSASPVPAPALLAPVVAAMAGGPVGSAGAYGPGLAAELSASGLAGALPTGSQLRVAVALGLVGVDDLAAAAGMDRVQAAQRFGVADAAARPS